MTDVITKASDKEIQIERTTSTVQVSKVALDDLYRQRKAIEDSMNAQAASFAAQIVEVEHLIAEAERLGIKSEIVTIKEEVDAGKG